MKYGLKIEGITHLYLNKIRENLRLRIPESRPVRTLPDKTGFRNYLSAIIQPALQ